MRNVSGVVGVSTPKNMYYGSAKGKQMLENSYPKRMSGFGIEGWEERKEMIVWA